MRGEDCIVKKRKFPDEVLNAFGNPMPNPVVRRLKRLHKKRHGTDESNNNEGDEEYDEDANETLNIEMASHGYEQFVIVQGPDLPTITFHDNSYGGMEGETTPEAANLHGAPFTNLNLEEKSPETASPEDEIEAPDTSNYKGGYKYPTHPPGYGGRPSEAPAGPFTYDSALILAYAEPSDIDICNAALMILESADTAKHDMPSANRDFLREAIAYGHTEANSHEVDIPARDPSPKKEWGEIHPSRTTKLATMPKPCSWCGTEANLERCTERCRRELCQECLPTTKHHPCSVWANMVWENAIGDTELRETHSIEAAPGGAKELSKEALEMSTTTYTCATRDISEPDHMSEPVQVTSVGALKHAIDSTHARKPEESPSETEWRAADRKSVDIISRAGGSYFEIGDAGKQGQTTLSVVQKKIKIAKPTEKGAHKSRKAIDGAWRPRSATPRAARRPWAPTAAPASSSTRSVAPPTARRTPSAVGPR